MAKSNASKIPAEKPSLKSRGKKLNSGDPIGMPQDLKADEGSSSLKKSFSGNGK